MDDRKHLGCCSVCDTPCFEIVAKFPKDHAFAGEIRTVGRPLPGVKRLTLVRASGRQSFCTLCASCTLDSLSFSKLHRKEVGALLFERRIEKDSPEQAERRAVMERLFAWDIPLGVLVEQSWSEVR